MMFKERNLDPRAHCIVTGIAENWQGQGRTKAAPKRAVIGTVLTLLQSERLHIANGLGFGPALSDELLNFRMKVPAVEVTIEAMRENANDDLVFAVALGCWWGDKLERNEEIAQSMLPAVELDDWGTGIDDMGGY